MVRHRAKNLITALWVALTFGLGFSGSGDSATPVYDADKIVINIPSRTLWVYEGDKIVRYFPVGVGRPGFMTPMGKFKVIRKIVNPGWEHPYQPSGKIRIAPGENNPLGTRWIGFHRKNGGEYGVHGTDNPSSVGKFSSHGCVRMKVPDAEALFDMVNVGTPVEVTYETVLVRKAGNDIRLIVYPDRFNRGMPSLEAVQGKIMAQFPNAHVDPERIKAALAQRNERPLVVGMDMPSASVANTEP